jgi:hypothetical protein
MGSRRRIGGDYRSSITDVAGGRTHILGGAGGSALGTHNQRSFTSMRQPAPIAALRTAFRAPSAVGATPEIMPNSSPTSHRQVPLSPRPSQDWLMRIQVSVVSSIAMTVLIFKIEGRRNDQNYRYNAETLFLDMRPIN